MPRLEDLSEVVRQSYLNVPVFEHDNAPFVRPSKPLPSGDESFRVIPSATPASLITQSHSSVGFDRSAFIRDVNISFPIERLRELAERGEIGSLATDFYSFMGAVRSPRRMERETGPEVAGRLLADGVEIVLLTPT
jgi:D-proline reductase (dithiol) PrdB